MPVRILITGGTFDKEYDEITGKLYFKDTHMREILDLGRSKLEVLPARRGGGLPQSDARPAA